MNVVAKSNARGGVRSPVLVTAEPAAPVTREPAGRPKPNRGDRRRERTRRRLVAAGHALISEEGVGGLRISEITERADVALGSFYNHFESKEDLVDTVVAESLAALARAVATPAVPGQDPAETVSLAIRQFVALAYEDPKFAQLVMHLDHADALFVTSVHPYARQALEVGIASGRFNVPDLEVVLTGIVGGAMALMRAIVDGRLQHGAEAAYAELALRILGLDAAEAAEIARREAPAAGDGAVAV